MVGNLGEITNNVCNYHPTRIRQGCFILDLFPRILVHNLKNG